MYIKKASRIRIFIFLLLHLCIYFLVYLFLYIIIVLTCRALLSLGRCEVSHFLPYLFITCPYIHAFMLYCLHWGQCRILVGGRETLGQFFSKSLYVSTIVRISLFSLLKKKWKIFKNKQVITSLSRLMVSFLFPFIGRRSIHDLI